jgi:hypothetical protein
VKNTILLSGVLLALLVGDGEVHGQTADRAPRWSIGTSLTYPIARIYQIHIGYRLDERHELIFGPAYQNFESRSITSHAYTLLLGYRYYAWKGLNLEVELWPAWNNMYSDVTDSRYPGVELWTEIKVGYKLQVYRDLFLQPAPGVGFGVFRTNRPPRFEEDIKSPSFAPQLILGVTGPRGSS